MSKTKNTVELGINQFGQKITAERITDYMKRKYILIRKEPENQRDDLQIICINEAQLNILSKMRETEADGGLCWAQTERQRYIYDVAKTQGHISRKDIMNAFNVSVPCASKDIALFIKQQPGKLKYCHSKKRYNFARLSL